MIFNKSIDTIPQTVANPSFGKKGEAIFQGRLMTRAILGDDPRFHIAAKIFNQSKWIDRVISYLAKKFNYYVELETKNGKNTLLNVNSIVNRLHLKKEDIYQAADNGTLGQLLVDQSKKMGPILDKYSDMVTKNQIVGKQNNISPHIWLKAVKIALTKKREIIEVKNKRFFATLDKENLSLLHIAKKLGSGSFGEAHLAWDVINGKEKVLKQAKEFVKSSTVEFANAAIRQEFNLLSEIHAKGKVWGLQGKPTQMVELLKSKIVGFLGKKYDGDYENDINKHKSVPFGERLREFHQLLGGLKYLADHDILHGDIKPGNIFVKNTREGLKLVHIADLGGACRATDTVSLKDIADRVCTPFYTSGKDLDLSEEFQNKNQRNQLIELEKKRDVFAMGMTFYEALTGGKSPFKHNFSGFPILSGYQEIQDKSIPVEIKNLIREMLNADYKDRPSADNAFKILDDYMKMNYRKYHTEIQEKIKAEYPGTST